MQQEEHDLYLYEYLQFVYQLWAKSCKYIVQKIMEKVTNFLTWPQFVLGCSEVKNARFPFQAK